MAATTDDDKKKGKKKVVVEEDVGSPTSSDDDDDEDDDDDDDEDDDEDDDDDEDGEDEDEDEEDGKGEDADAGEGESDDEVKENGIDEPSPPSLPPPPPPPPQPSKSPGKKRKPEKASDENSGSKAGKGDGGKRQPVKVIDVSEKVKTKKKKDGEATKEKKVKTPQEQFAKMSIQDAVCKYIQDPDVCQRVLEEIDRHDRVDLKKIAPNYDFPPIFLECFDDLIGNKNKYTYLRNANQQSRDVVNKYKDVMYGCPIPTIADRFKCVHRCAELKIIPTDIDFPPPSAAYLSATNMMVGDQPVYDQHQYEEFFKTHGKDKAREFYRRLMLTIGICRPRSHKMKTLYQPPYALHLVKPNESIHPTAARGRRLVIATVGGNGFTMSVRQSLGRWTGGDYDVGTLGSLLSVKQWRLPSNGIFVANDLADDKQLVSEIRFQPVDGGSVYLCEYPEQVDPSFASDVLDVAKRTTSKKSSSSSSSSTRPATIDPPPVSNYPQFTVDFPPSLIEDRSKFNEDCFDLVVHPSDHEYPPLFRFTPVDQRTLITNLVRIPVQSEQSPTDGNPIAAIALSLLVETPVSNFSTVVSWNIKSLTNLIRGRASGFVDKPFAALVEINPLLNDNRESVILYRQPVDRSPSNQLETLVNAFIGRLLSCELLKSSREMCTSMECDVDCECDQQEAEAVNVPRDDCIVKILEFFRLIHAPNPLIAKRSIEAISMFYSEVGAFILTLPVDQWAGWISATVDMLHRSLSAGDKEFSNQIGEWSWVSCEQWIVRGVVIAMEKIWPDLKAYCEGATHRKPSGKKAVVAEKKVEEKTTAATKRKKEQSPSKKTKKKSNKGKKSPSKKSNKKKKQDEKPQPTEQQPEVEKKSNEPVDDFPPDPPVIEEFRWPKHIQKLKMLTAGDLLDDDKYVSSWMTTSGCLCGPDKEEEEFKFFLTYVFNEFFDGRGPVEPVGRFCDQLKKIDTVVYKSQSAIVFIPLSSFDLPRKEKGVMRCTRGNSMYLACRDPVKWQKMSDSRRRTTGDNGLFWLTGNNQIPLIRT